MQDTKLNNYRIFSIPIADMHKCHTIYACFSVVDDLQEVQDILRREQDILRYYSLSGQNIKQKKFSVSEYR